MSRLARPLSARTRRQVIEQVAPRYREASFAQKILLLDAVVEASGYARKYAIMLLNQPAERTPTLQQHSPLASARSEVLQALFFAWNVANWICAKRLIPFLPTLIDALERHGHLHLTQESRNHLLQVSPATAERLLHTQRHPAPQGLSTTKAGPLLKHQIPIRTFHEWNETQPGFLEADLVAHCGGQPQGSFLYTLTLTDIATGWTECLPLLYRSPEMVEAALIQARTLFPFPILGIDTDNGKEFINEIILAYCEREHLTFTRGRPECKNDQCHVEQKNGAVVRPFVGYGRFVGEQSSRQLGELYRALRLYVNCFQPSMKLQSKSYDGQRIRRHYHPAKTPFQRLLLSEILPDVRQQELSEVVRALDPLGLFEQVKQLQEAFLQTAVSPFSSPLSTPVPAFLRFSLDHCFQGSPPETLEWHQTALRLVQQYLMNLRHLRFLSQITEKEVRDWLAFLRTPSSMTGISRKTGTIATYGRSFRAFCHWAVRKGYLEHTPMARGILPKVEKKHVQVIEPEAFDCLLLACRPAGESGASLDRVAVRNRSILWVLMDTGMRVSDLCGLCLSDVNHEQRSLRVQGRGNERWLTLSPNGWFQVLSYLEHARPKKGFSEEEQVREAPLFLSETYHPLTINALTLLFGRLRKRAGMTEEPVTPSLLRDTFAVRYVQAGGEPEALRAILGLTGMESVKRYG